MKMLNYELDKNNLKVVNARSVFNNQKLIPVYTPLMSNVVLHGLPNNIPPYLYKSAEYSLYTGIREAIRRKFFQKNGYNFSEEYCKWMSHDYKNIKRQIQDYKELAKNDPKYKQNIRVLNERLNSIKATRSDKLKIAQKNHYGSHAAALRFTNIAVKRIVNEISKENPKAIRIARRYPMKFRGEILKACLKHERFAQLCETFPLLAGVIFCDIRTKFDIQENVTGIKQMVIDGVKLKHICEKYDIPYPLRKIKPQTMSVVDFRKLLELYKRDEKVFTHYMPKKTMEQYRWLKVVFGSLFLERGFVSWITKTLHTQCGRKLEILFNEINLLSDAYRDAPWEMHINWHQAMRIQQDWHEEIALKRHNGINKKFPKPWIPGYNDENGYSIVPLTDTMSLEKEAATMHHCVHMYSDRVFNGTSYIYSVRKDDVNVGTLELAKNGVGKYRIQQLRGHCNSDVSKNDKEFVRKWVQNAIK